LELKIAYIPNPPENITRIHLLAEVDRESLIIRDGHLIPILCKYGRQNFLPRIKWQQGHLCAIHPNGHINQIEKGKCTLNNVQMGIGYRVKRSGKNGNFHTFYELGDWKKLKDDWPYLRVSWKKSCWPNRR